MTDPRRALPSVGTLLEHAALRPLLEQMPRALVSQALRAVIDDVRQARRPQPSDEHGWADLVSRAVARSTRPSLRHVVNATGVVLHTNLGRAPLAQAAIDAMLEVAGGYSNVEYDLDRGERGSRYVHCAALLRELTGAEDALVVNNGAGALVLALATHCEGRDAVISRGELVEIGGSFRVPDIMRRSGARLCEVGTTNRTHRRDYLEALGERAGAVVKVHRSNFAIEGFVAEVPAHELAAIATAHGVPLIHDLGSGLLVHLDDVGLTGEPTAAEAIEAGATIVLMSGDKLLGGPQAGLIVGSARAIAAMRENPLARTYRVDKLTLAALEATLSLYRDPLRARREIPTLAMLTASREAVVERAGRLAASLPESVRDRVEVVASSAAVGGGAFPTATLPSAGIALRGHAETIERMLRAGVPPVIGRVTDGRVRLDLRTVLPADEPALREAIVRALGAS